MFGPDLVFSNTTYRQLDKGRYMNDASTLDEPTILTLKSSPKAQGESSYLIRLDYSKNRVGLPDAKLATYIVVRGDIAGNYSNDVIIATSAHLQAFLADAARAARFFKGEV